MGWFLIIKRYNFNTHKNILFIYYTQMIKAENIIVNQLIKGLEKWNIPWRKTWITKWQKNFISQKLYKGFNQMLLSYIADENKRSDCWVSYKQAIELWWNLKDEKWTKIVFYKKITKKEKWKEDKDIFFLKYYNIFNLSQVKWIDLPKQEKIEIKENKNISKDIKNYMVNEKIKPLDWEPCYSPSNDYIKMPNINLFDNSKSYYSTYFHEIIHSTGNSKRLDRKVEIKNETEYSKEELVAEIGSAILMNENWLEYNKKNTQAYINWWIKLLKDKPKTIITASNKSFEAVNYYLNAL